MKLDCLTRIGSFVVALVAAGICLFPCTPALAQSDPTLVQTAVALTASGTDDDARQGRVTLTALVSLTDGGAVPDGTIEFIDVDTNRLVGRTSAAQARITVDRLPAGPHVFRADYSGVMRYFPFVIDPSRSATVAYAVRTVPSVSLSSSQNPSLPGEIVTLTAAVTDKSGVPAGSVTFHDGNTIVARDVALDSHGIASFTTSVLPDGPRTIVASYSGDASHAPAVSQHLAQDVSAEQFATH